MENEEKKVVTETEGSNFGLYCILFFSFAVFVAMLVTAYIDHN
ncbi:hypothetical protein [Halobacteriovorax sp. JY17]|nr:hypothetical protein [Halobacteriovorax sp. JY17]